MAGFSLESAQPWRRALRVAGTSYFSVPQTRAVIFPKHRRKDGWLLLSTEKIYCVDLVKFVIVAQIHSVKIPEIN
jgi:hypothetical protein